VAGILAILVTILAIMALVFIYIEDEHVSDFSADLHEDLEHIYDLYSELEIENSLADQVFGPAEGPVGDIQ